MKFHTMKLKRAIAAVAAAAMLLPIVGCGGDKTPAPSGSPAPTSSTTPDDGGSKYKVDEIRVGYTSLQSGAMAVIGPIIDWCVDTAKQDFEARTGVKVDLVVEDAGSTLESAIDATVRLIDDDVSCIIGILGSTQYAGMLQELEEVGNIPLMTTVAPDEIFTRGYDWLFCSYVTRLQENAGMLAWAKSIGAKSVACMLGTDDDSRALMEYFIEEGAKQGIEIYPEWINPADTDFTANITSARAKNPDAYYCLSAATTMSQILRQMKQLGIDKPLNTGAALGVQSFVDLMEPEELEGMYGQASILPPYMIDDPMVQDYVAKYTEATGWPADITTLVYYDCAMLLFEAAAGAGNDGEAIKDYLRNEMQGYQGITGVYNFDEAGLGRWECYLLRAGANKEVELVETLKLK
ncbi:MAG: ABC transporter substrate-binding protein [Oscillospiraceae bacterium]|nr:ABC transporter substrate-binding protein [Oscillospiraceae bacterium]